VGKGGQKHTLFPGIGKEIKLGGGAAEVVQKRKGGTKMSPMVLNEGRGHDPKGSGWIKNGETIRSKKEKWQQRGNVSQHNNLLVEASD